MRKTFFSTKCHIWREETLFLNQNSDRELIHCSHNTLRYQMSISTKVFLKTTSKYLPSETNLVSVAQTVYKCNLKQFKGKQSNSQFFAKKQFGHAVTSSSVDIQRSIFCKNVLWVSHHKMHFPSLLGTFYRIQLSLKLLELCRHTIFQTKKYIL